MLLTTLDWRFCVLVARGRPRRMERSPGMGRSRDDPSFCRASAAGGASLHAAEMAAVGKVVSPSYSHPGIAGEGSLSRVSFLGARPPAEVEAMARSVRDLGKETFRKLLKGRAKPQSKAKLGCCTFDPERLAFFRLVHFPSPSPVQWLQFPSSFPPSNL